MSYREVISDAPNSTWTKAASGICILLIVVASLLPQAERVSTSLPGKFEHLIAYGVTGLLLGLAVPGKNGPLFGGLMLSGIACLLEVLQHWSPGRHPRVSDAVVGAAAGILGAAVATWLRKDAEGKSASLKR